MVNIEEFKNWTPEAQRKALEIIERSQMREWHPFYCKNPVCDGRPHINAPQTGMKCPGDKYGHWWREKGGKWVCDPEFGCGQTGTPVDEWLFGHARADQRPPPWYERWRTWFTQSGRGSGKTETGSRLTHKAATKTPHLILVGATGPDLRATMVEGPSGILATAPPDKRPEWEPSKKKLTFPNGAVALGFSAEEPDRLRGPQSGYAWLDEPSHFDFIEQVWDNLLFGLRLGRPSHVLCTSTPLPIKWVKDVTSDPKTIAIRVATYANMYNLDPEYRNLLLDKYEGTRLGQQELHGEILGDVEGALWQGNFLKHGDAPDHFDRVVVAVDPAGSANKKSDETGIIVLGISDGIVYVLEDLTGVYSPSTWGTKAIKAHEKWSADAIVAEKNYGGDMVQHVLDTEAEKNARGLVRVKLVQSRRGKALRAEPIVAQYEKGRVIHVGKHGELAELEDEQLTWIPGQGSSPNRVDALVHGATDLFRGSGPAVLSRPSQLLKNYRMPIPRGIQ